MSVCSIVSVKYHATRIIVGNLVRIIALLICFYTDWYHFIS